MYIIWGQTTLIIEGIGAILISINLIPIYGPIEGIGKSIFHSVSSFCNAGFDLFGTESNQFASLTGFQNNPLMLITTSVLIIIGGLGFIVWSDVAKNKKFARLTLHTKIVLIMTVILLLVGTIAYMYFESSNTLKDLSVSSKLLNSFFLSTSARTAGFNSLNLAQMRTVSCLITIVLMFIGAAPGSTAGGIKTTTFFVLLLTVFSSLRGRTEIHAFKKRISPDIINKTISIFILGISLILLSTIILLVNNEGTLLQSFFESTSAFGTVGLSTGITPNLNDLSKIQLIITMLLGRVGTITAIAAFASSQGNKNIAYKCPEGKITVG